MVSLVSPASLTEWSIAIVGVIGSLGGLLKVSNCSTIKCFCLQCIREQPPSPPVVDLPEITREEVENNV